MAMKNATFAIIVLCGCTQAPAEQEASLSAIAKEFVYPNSEILDDRPPQPLVIHVKLTTKDAALDVVQWYKRKLFGAGSDEIVERILCASGDVDYVLDNSSRRDGGRPVFVQNLYQRRVAMKYEAHMTITRTAGEELTHIMITLLALGGK